MRLLLATAAAGLAACGGPSEEDKVRDTVETFGQAVAAKDYSRLCDEILSAELLGKLMSVGQPCTVALAQGFGPAVEPTVEILNVDVRSERQALVRVRTDAANQEPSIVTLRMVKEAEQWRVGSLSEPDSAPPGTQAPGGSTPRAPAPGGSAPSPSPGRATPTAPGRSTPTTPAPAPAPSPTPPRSGTTAP